MAVKVESLSGIQVSAPAFGPQARPATGMLSREQRLAHARRRRRSARFHSALEGALWLGGSGALVTFCIAGLFGLR